MKFNPMALKDVDWKQFFIEKGERVGLGFAAVIMVIITIVSLFMPNHGFLVPAASTNAKELIDAADKVDTNQRNAVPGDSDKPGVADTTVKYDSAGIENPEQYRVSHLWLAPPINSTKRRMPNLYNIDEATAEVVLSQIRAYVFSGRDDNEFDSIQILEGVSGPTRGSGTGSQVVRANNAPPQGFPNSLQQARQGGGGGLLGNSSAFLGQAPGGQGAAPTGISSLRPRGDRGFNTPTQSQVLNNGLPGSMGGAPGGRSALTPRFVKVSDITDETSYHYAERVMPLRQAIICATFPYRKQVEEFQRKLRLPTPFDVTGELSEESFNGTPLPSFRFLGVDVQRRELGPDGKPLMDWESLDLARSLRPYIIRNGTRFEPDKPQYQALMIEGLSMPLLLQFDENKSNTYPDLESRLVNIRKTLEALEAKKPDEIVVATSPLVDKDNFDPFNYRRSASNSASAPRGNGPKPPPVASPQITAQGPSGRPLRPGGDLVGRGGRGQAADLGDKTRVLPDHVLVRVVDVNIEPGKIYEYRLHVRMANPNFKRNGEVLSPSYAQDPELRAEKNRKDSDWFVVPKKVTVPPEFQYYAVDQKEVEPAYSGIHARDSVHSDQQTAFQIHRWLEDANREGKGDWVGEWTVAERVIVSKGEFIGRTELVQVPIWQRALEAFVLAVPPADTPGMRKRDIGIPVDFRLANDDAVLVDFEGGPQHFKRTAKHGDRSEALKIDDRITQEVLLVSSEGRVTARNSATDAYNAERVNRLTQWRQRMRDILFSGKGAPALTTASPFAPGGAGGMRPTGAPGGASPPGPGGRTAGSPRGGF
jgi:hypothetical protein